ncbi:response regulator [Magnetovibrio sp. PR-2]|uniref:response regulator n=1 Tax=Magnetovibrio sp. PR-2 TaxID=3120356 RepID=UPI002FCDE36F
MDKFDWGRTKVLVVDDDPAIAQLIEIVLRQLGVRFLATSDNGQDALERLHKKVQTPNIIILDMQMPVMNGFEFIAELRKLSDPDINTIPVLACTAIAKQEVVDEALRLGVDGFIVKPFSAKSLSERLETVLEPIMNPA